MLLVLAALAVAEPPEEETTEIAYGVEVDGNVRYLWRGVEYTQGPTLNPGGYFDIGSFEVWAWGNMPVAPVDGFSFNELDLGATWTGEAGPVTLTPGLTSYHAFEGGYSATVEAAVEASVPIAGPVFAVTRQTVDILAYPKGYYGEIGIGAGNEDETVDAELTLAVGNGVLNENYYGFLGFAPLLVDLHGGYSWYLTDTLYLRPHATVVYKLPDLAAATGETVGWNAGLAFGWGI